VVLLRLAYRARHPAPPLPPDVPGWQRAAARATHAGLYALLLVMPLAGYVRVRAGGFPIEALDALGLPTLVPRSDALAGVAKATHLYASYALVALVALHVAAALQHALWRRDGVVSRMWPPWGAPRAAPRARRPSAAG
jgi:cytochrome b561